MIKTLLSFLFQPAAKLMGKISYLQKVLLILLFFIFPLIYASYALYDKFQQDFEKLHSYQTGLQKSYALYKMILLLQKYENRVSEYAQGGEGLDEKAKIKQSEVRLQAQEEKLFFLLEKSAQNTGRHLHDKASSSLAEEEYARFFEYAGEYKRYLYEEIVKLGSDPLDTHMFLLDNIPYLLELELPLSLLHTAEINTEKQDKAFYITWGKLLSSVEKTDKLLKNFSVYETDFKALNNAYQKAVQKYQAYLLEGKVRYAIALQESVLDQQLSLFEALQNYLNGYLQAEQKKMRRHLSVFVILIVLFAFFGLYFFIGAYQSLRRSLEQFFSTTLKLSKGKLRSRVKVSSSDEMGKLSSEFNDMIESLDYHYALLNEYKRAVDESAIVVKTDINGTITYVNEAYEKISAYSKEELIGSSQRLVQSKNTSHEQINDIWKYIMDKKVYKTIFENIAKNGKSFYVESTIVPILDRSGEISEFISIMFDITPLYKQKEKLQSKLYIDELTSLPNRLKLIEDIALTQKPKLVVMNIDGFKEINAIYGENIGDQTLQKMGKEIKSSLNTRHLQVYKLSADEFAILAGEEISIRHFKEDVAILSHYLSHLKLECGTDTISVRISLGAAISELHQSQRPLISMADMALKEAKRRMRPYVFYHDIACVDEDLEKNYKMVQLIEQAIKEDKVGCCYQGIINAKSGKIEKYEVLMRLEDEEGKMISPQSFVSIAKRTRYYPRLTQKVVQEAIFTFLNRSESVSINLSVDDIMDDTTYLFIIDALHNCGCPERIVFEFLESEEIEFNERVAEFTSQVKKLGSQIAIDDFGSGYSNYAYLMKLGVDILKIDASLIKDVDKNSDIRLITKSIIDIAHALGMQTVAEHIHTKEVEQVMIEMGIDYLQGFYLHKPVCEL